MLKSGGNDFHGAAFLNYLNDGMVGRSIRGNRVPSQISQTNYGGFLSGPIWKDRVFFAASYELYESSDLTSTGPTGAGFANSINGIDQALIDRVVGIFNSNYASEFDAGSIPRTKPIVDEKYSLKLDANITDRHRLARRALALSRSSRAPTRHELGRLLPGYSREETILRRRTESQWTDNFSTLSRLAARLLAAPEPAVGHDFSDVDRPWTPPPARWGSSTTTCIVRAPQPLDHRFWPDEFRMHRAGDRQPYITFKGEYALPTTSDVGSKPRSGNLNTFIPTQDGQYYFDSFRTRGRPRQIRVRYPTRSLPDTTDAAAGWST